MAQRSIKVSITVLFLLLLLTTFFANGISNVYAGTIVGIITECTANGSPIEGVEIILDEVVLGTSDANGHYEVDPGSQGVFDVVYSKTGYIEVEVEDIRVGGQPVPVDVIMLNPVGNAYPDFIELQVPIGAGEDSTAQARLRLSNSGCGQLYWGTRIDIVETPWLMGAHREVNPRNIFKQERKSGNHQISLKKHQEKSFSSGKRNPASFQKGPVVPTNEIDELWDNLFSMNASDLVAEPLLAGPVVTEDYIYVTGGNYAHLYKFTHNGEFVDSIAYAEQLCPNPAQDFGPLDLDYDGEYLYGGIFSNNGQGNIYKFLPDMSEVEFLGNVGHSVTAIAYDWDNEFIYTYEWSNNFRRLNLNNNSYDNLGADPIIGDVMGLTYMPADEEGYTIWIFSQGTDGNSAIIYRYNPDTEQFDYWGTPLYPPTDPNGEDVYMAGGMSVSNGYNISRWDVATLYQGEGDIVDIWEGIFAQTPWVFIEDDQQGGMINPNGQDRYITLNVDITAAHLEEQVNVTPGSEGIAELYFTGRVWEGYGPIDILVHFVDHVDVSDTESNVPNTYKLDQCYPNPFNSTTTATINLPQDSELKLTVNNILGQEVAVLFDGFQKAGSKTFSFDASAMSAGVYFLHANVPGKMNEIQKIVYMK